MAYLADGEEGIHLIHDALRQLPQNMRLFDVVVFQEVFSFLT